VVRSRWPLLRRISQISFLVLFVGLLIFTSLRPAPGATSDIHLRAPVRLFFLLDPLVAVSNALASHALYRGLILCLVILLPTLFLGRFFCGWICPMGTLQHVFGNLPSEAKRGKQRIESNRYKRWQTTKYVVLIAGLVAACFGSMALGWLDPFSLLVRSVGLALLPAFNFAVRALLTPMEHSHTAIIKTAGATLHSILQATILDFRQTHFAQGLVLGILFLLILGASLRVTRLWCRAICPLGALLGAVSRFSVLGLHKDEAKCNRCNRCLLDCQGGDDLSGPRPFFSLLSQRERSCFARPDAAQDADGACRRCRSSSTDARQYRARQRTARSPAASSRLARRNRVSLALYSLRRMHEGLPQQFAASDARPGRSRRAVDAGIGAAHRLLRAELRAVFRGLPYGSDLADNAEGEGLGGRRGRAVGCGGSADSPGHCVL
jgi:hypothetical protein